MAAERESSTTRVISALQARQKFGQLLDQVRFQGYRFLVERAGQPMAVMVGIEEWENIIETLAEIDDPDYLASIRQARREIEIGKTLSLEELKAEFAKSHPHGP